MVSLFANYNNRIVQLPVNPEELKIKGNADNKTTSMVGQGELNNIGYSKLKELCIESFFPISEASYVNTSGQFEGIKKDRRPFRLIITEKDINMLVSIESFEYGYKHGTDDVDYVLELKEYREHNIKILAPVASSNTINVTTSIDTTTSNNNVQSNQPVAPVSAVEASSDRVVEKEVVKTYIIQDGDTLWKIAQKLLGNGNRWNDIYTYNNNKNIIGGNPNYIRAGKTLSIPPTSYVGPKVSITNTTKTTSTSKVKASYLPGTSSGGGAGGRF